MPSACWDRRYQRSGPEGPETPAETKVTPEGHDTLRAERTSLPEAESNARDMLAWAVGIFAEAVPNDAAGAEPTFAHAVARTVEEPTEELASVQLHVPSDWRVAATQVVPRDPFTSKETFQARSNCPPEADRVMDEPFEETVARTDSVPRATAESSSSGWASSASASASASSASSAAAAGGSLGAAFCAGGTVASVPASGVSSGDVSSSAGDGSGSSGSAGTTGSDGGSSPEGSSAGGVASWPPSSPEGSWAGVDGSEPVGSSWGASAGVSAGVSSAGGVSAAGPDAAGPSGSGAGSVVPSGSPMASAAVPAEPPSSPVPAGTSPTLASTAAVADSSCDGLACAASGAIWDASATLSSAATAGLPFLLMHPP